MNNQQNNLNNHNDQDPKERLNSYARFSGIAFQMIAIIAIGTFVGVKLDEKYPNKYSLFSMILSFSSVIIALIFVIKRIIAVSKNDK